MADDGTLNVDAPTFTRNTSQEQADTHSGISLRQRFGHQSMDEAKICPRCSLEQFMYLLPKPVSYTRLPADESNVKLCARLRAFASNYGKTCPYFPTTENILKFAPSKLFIQRSERWKKRAKLKW